MNIIKVSPINEHESTRPIWSVIIPIYNCSNYLKQTLENVLIQDKGPEHMEIWVVDDFSNDSPNSIVDEFGKGRVKYFRQDQNVGQINNFSTGLNLSKGRIIHLLHGDDFIHDGFYQSLEGPLLADPCIGAGFTGNNIIDEKGKLMYKSKIIKSKPGIIENFISIIARNQVIQTPSIVVKREVYEKLGAFNKDLSWVEDWEMWIRIACNYKFFYTPNILASYRLHSSSNTANSITTGRFVKDVLKCINVYSSYLLVSKTEKKDIVNSAKDHYINFAVQQAIDKHSVLILLRALPLVHNLPSLILIAKKVVSVYLRRNGWI